MKEKRSGWLAGFCLVVALAGTALGGERFEPLDVFRLEFASDPRISPAGDRVVYVRNRMDIMTDRSRSDLWIVNSDGAGHRALTSGQGSHFSPRWSPSADRLAYISTESGSPQIHLRWMDTGQTAQLTHLTESPSGVTWSPDGKWLAFSMFVPEKSPPLAEMPERPEGAEWAEPAKVIRKLQYRADGEGYLKDGHEQIFVVSADGGSARQITSGEFDNGGDLAWTADSQALVFSANRHENAEYDPLNSEIYRVALDGGQIVALTSRQGPDSSPAVSPDGKWLAYLGFDDRLQGYQVRRLHVMDANGGGSRVLTADFDRGVDDAVWSGDGKGIFFQYDDRGNGKIGYISAEGGEIETLASDVGGLSLGRPYSGGSFSVSRDGRFAFTRSSPDRPADAALGKRGDTRIQALTRLNEELLGHKRLGAVEEIWFKSSFDGRDVQGWIVKPPDFSADKKYPLILEIHGGPFANYGDRFAAEIQLYAAAGYLVLYTNPRGSTSYGEEFGNLIHHNYPGQDYDDLMSGVDAVIAKGYVDDRNLFVTGGSGGGVLTSWIVGKTDRFRAAVVAKPVINWYSFVLTSDATGFFYKYWFPGFPWEHVEQYMKRSPISYAGNVNTPTMLLTGEVDYRTPISESEQFYEALKLRKIDTVLVRIPGASHGIANRPSNLIAKVAHILKWFELHRAS